MSDPVETPSSETLSPEDARILVARGICQVLDIRDEDEFADARIAGAFNAAGADSLPDELSEEEPVLVVCTDGERSKSLARSLLERGIESGSVEGGMNAWLSDGLPVQPSADITT